MSSLCRVSLLLLLALGACQREDRDFRGPPPPPQKSSAGVSPTSFWAGENLKDPPTDPAAETYRRNAFHISEGKRYYDWYNCYGCHASGGGDIGPPLMDEAWRYGGSIEQVHASIVEGRPNGMPAFRTRIPDAQAWELAAYVLSMSAQTPKDAAASRGDELSTGRAKTQVDRQPPKGKQSPTEQGLPQ